MMNIKNITECCRQELESIELGRYHHVMKEQGRQVARIARLGPCDVRVQGESGSKTFDSFSSAIPHFDSMYEQIRYGFFCAVECLRMP